MRIAKQTLSRKPKFQPKPTRLAVVAASTYVIQIAEKSVSDGDRDAKRTTIVLNPIAIPAAPIAVFSIEMLVSYHQNAPLV